MVELDPRHSHASLWARASLAHELGHTLLYDLGQRPPAPLTSLRVGDADLEWLCWQIGRALLIPAEWLCDQVGRYPIPGQNGFSLRAVDKLARAFAVPWELMAARLVEDLGLWPCVMMQFALLQGARIGGKTTEEPSWRLKWQTMPEDGTEELFLPLGRRVQGKMRFPRAKGALESFIAQRVDEAEDGAAFDCDVPRQAMGVSALGNLGKFLRGKTGTDDIRASCLVRKPEQSSTLGSWRNTIPSAYMLLSWPLASG